MDHKRKELLAQKKAQLKVKQQREEIRQYKDRLSKSIEDFSQKYRYADEAEEVILGKFISKLDFAQPGQLSIQEACPYPHENVHLCFLMGTEALFQIFIFGKYDDILRDYDEWVSSSTSVSAGTVPSALAAVRKISGSGLDAENCSPEIRALK